jgi:hypothetical protein
LQIADSFAHDTNTTKKNTRREGGRDEKERRQ